MFRRYDNDSRRYLVIDGRTPSRGVLARTIKRHFGVHILEAPINDRSLEFLRPFIGDLEALIVTDPNCRDFSILDQAFLLRSLDVWSSPKGVVKFAGASLERFGARALPSWRNVRTISSLQDITLEGGDFSWFQGSSLKPARIALTSARNVESIPDGEEFSRVKVLELHGCRGLDLAGLKHWPSVTSLELSAVRSVSGFADAGLERLDNLQLENVESIDYPDAILDYPPRMLRVIGVRHPFDTEVTSSPIAKERKWTFPPGRTGTGKG